MQPSLILGCKNASKMQYLPDISQHWINWQTPIYIIQLARIVKLMDWLSSWTRGWIVWAGWEDVEIWFA